MPPFVVANSLLVRRAARPWARQHRTVTLLPGRVGTARQAAPQRAHPALVPNFRKARISATTLTPPVGGRYCHENQFVPRDGGQSSKCCLIADGLCVQGSAGRRRDALAREAGDRFEREANEEPATGDGAGPTISAMVQLYRCFARRVKAMTEHWRQQAAALADAGTLLP